jgi:two-component system phosphate regulon sensor histidine kinase PhoR
MQFKDSGVGISPDDLPHIFERFYRSDKMHAQKIQGAGLGLSIVHTICLVHGGRVVAESLLNQGSTFTITLPRVEALPKIY